MCSGRYLSPFPISTPSGPSAKAMASFDARERRLLDQLAA
ncbi:hypothetical protein GA0115255_119595, partial [Streptomyces sp. Ncost-T6T-2b]